ncbi:hypothetical protein N2384_01825 [Bacillus paralicheniformis]|uniref:hypothetical protein n=1 Tax=Bacillus paralicheniformis TaxID=1648923 RepID=UPI0021A3894C|nr:hypothetical protein [Bacillus paralicheniformis]UWS61975.1 hypothetical protein N2384_01825 [Bacillus paralicheniformis]
MGNRIAEQRQWMNLSNGVKRDIFAVKENAVIEDGRIYKILIIRQVIFKPDLPQRFYNESMQQIHVKRSRTPFRKEITLLRNERQKAESGGKGQNIPADA